MLGGRRVLMTGLMDVDVVVMGKTGGERDSRMISYIGPTMSGMIRLV